MDTKRRAFLQNLAPWAIAASLGIFVRRSSAERTQRSTRQFPEPPSPGQLPPDSEPPPIDPTKLLKHNQQRIVEDAKKLYTLAGELKDQVEKTDSANILSLPLVKKAKEIEDLAKQIRSLALD